MMKILKTFCFKGIFTLKIGVLYMCKSVRQDLNPLGNKGFLNFFVEIIKNLWYKELSA